MKFSSKYVLSCENSLKRIQYSILSLFPLILTTMYIFMLCTYYYSLRNKC